MPDGVEPGEEDAHPYRDLEIFRSVANRAAEIRQTVEIIQPQNRAIIERISVTVSAIESSRETYLRNLTQSMQGIRSAIAAQMSKGSLIPPGLLSATSPFPQLSQIATIGAAPDSVLKNVLAEFARFSDSIRLQTRELLQSIQFAFPPLDPRLSDVMCAMDGDPAAAERLALGINWQPNGWQRECIRIKSRVDGESPERVRIRALTQGVLRALSGEKEDEIPILIGPQDQWLYDEQRNLATIAPLELPLDYFWNWINEEAARAAGLWLVGYPYAPSVILEVPPDGNSDWQFARFTSSPAKEQTLVLRGRPFGSGIFEDEQGFLEELRLAANQVKNRGHRVTQERVAESMSQRGLLGIESPERQLRRWVKEFGYSDWRDISKGL